MVRAMLIVLALVTLIAAPGCKSGKKRTKGADGGAQAAKCMHPCGNVCCANEELCNLPEEKCVGPCKPSCSGRACGPNGCGGQCGTGCAGNQFCNNSGSCVSTVPANEELYAAAEEADAGKVKKALEAGADVNYRTSQGTTALMLAAASNDRGLFDLLISKGADVNVVDNGGKSALSYAVERGQASMVSALAEKGANLNVRDPYGRTPLHTACSVDMKPEVAPVLISKGADVNAKAIDGVSPLLVATDAQRFDCTKLLLDKGADPNARDFGGVGPLMRAAQGCRPDEKEAMGEVSKANNKCNADMRALAKALVDKGADPNAKNEEGYTPVLTAIAQDRRETAKMLLERGGKAEGTIRYKKYTALYLAARMGDKDIVKMLIDRGADVNAADYEGTTPLKAALENGHKDAAEVIRGAGGKEQ